MAKIQREENGAMTLDLAAPAGSNGARVADLLRDRSPTARQSSRSWVDWSLEALTLGQVNDNRKIPLSKLEQMRLDPMIAFGLAYTKLPHLRALWSIESSRADVAAGADAALRAIYGRLCLALLNDLDFGYSPNVKRYQLEKPDWTYFDPMSGPDGAEVPVWPHKDISMVTFRPVVALNPRRTRIHWNQDESFGGIDYANMPAMGDGSDDLYRERGEPDVPVELALWSTNDRDRFFDDMYGYPRIGHVYRYWWSYWYTFSLADRAMERLADPPLVVWFPVSETINSEEVGSEANYRDVALGTGESARSGSTIAMPSTVLSTDDGRGTAYRAWDIQQMAVKENFDAFIQRFEYLDTAKLRGIWLPEQGLVEGSGGTSSRNVAQVFSDLSTESQHLKLSEIADIINRYILPAFVKANFGPDAKATFVPKGFIQKDVEMMQSIVQAMAQKYPERLPIDIRQALQDVGVPVLAPAELAKQLREAAAEAEAETPEPTPDSKKGSGANVNNAGKYEQGRAKVDLSRAQEERRKPLRERLRKILPFVRVPEE